MNSYFTVLFTSTDSGSTDTIDYSYINGTNVKLTGVWDSATITLSGKDSTGSAVTHEL